MGKTKRSKKKTSLARRADFHLKIKWDNVSNMEYVDLSSLLVYLTTKDPHYSPNWVEVGGLKSLKSIYFVYIPQIDDPTLKEIIEKEDEEPIPFFSQHYGGEAHMVFASPTKKPHKCFPAMDRFVNMFIKSNSLPKFSEQKRANYEKHVKDAGKKPRFFSSIEELLVPLDKLRFFNYKLEEDNGFVRAPEEAKDERKVVAIDCEMVITTEGFELARLSAVDWDLEQLLDLYVKPANPVLDYNTEYSGITEEILSNVTARVEDAREQLFTFVSRSTILVGHGLENDLSSLRIVHTRIIDTSLLYSLTGLYKPKLKYLAKKILGATIQEGEHSSLEDSTISMRLVKSKLGNPRFYGIERPKQPLNMENLFFIISQYRPVNIICTPFLAERKLGVSKIDYSTQISGFVKVLKIGYEHAKNIMYHPVRHKEHLVEWTMEGKNRESEEKHITLKIKDAIRSIPKISDEGLNPPFNFIELGGIGRIHAQISAGTLSNGKVEIRKELHTYGEFINDMIDTTMERNSLLIVYTGNGNMRNLINLVMLAQEQNFKDEEILKSLHAEIQLRKQGTAIFYTKGRRTSKTKRE